MRMKTPPVEGYATVCGEQVRIMAHHVSKTVWTAHGTYKKYDYEGKGRTASQAIEDCRSRINASEFN